MSHFIIPRCLMTMTQHRQNQSSIQVQLSGDQGMGTSALRLEKEASLQASSETFFITPNRTHSLLHPIWLIRDTAKQPHYLFLIKRALFWPQTCQKVICPYCQSHRKLFLINHTECIRWLLSYSLQSRDAMPSLPTRSKTSTQFRI